MLLKHHATGKLVEVLGVRDLFNPMHDSIVGRFSVGEELQDPESFAKAGLVFCSDEALPRCWTDVNYREEESHHYYRHAS